LAQELISDRLNLHELNTLDDDTVRTRLTKVKGIGNWSVDVYLMMVIAA
jgi:DNA-3-methyladenine glycosylase II